MLLQLISGGRKIQKIKDSNGQGRGELKDRAGTHVDPFNLWEKPGRTQRFDLDPISSLPIANQSIVVSAFG